MEVEFIGHASIRVRAAGVSLLMDPWLRGKAFNDGWDQCSPPAEVDCASIHDIWISHEHPDHFSVPTLRSIPEDDRKRIGVFYQRHASSRLADAIRGLGFARVTELPLYVWCEPSPGLELFCGSVGSMDSFLAVRSEGQTILNLNDCILNPLQLRYVARQVGPIDILFTQFSFANWVGNDRDEREGAKAKIAQLTTQIDTIRPRVTVPFASFIYFCNRENERMNAWTNTPEQIQSSGLASIEWMYPGDVWNSRDRCFDSESAIGRYRRDRETVEIGPTPTPKSSEELQSAGQKCMDRNRGSLRSFEAFSIHVHDLDRVITLRPGEHRIEILPATPERVDGCRYRMCSQVAWYSMNFSWGFNTTEVSGMYLDYDYATRGRNPFFFQQNLLSTEVLSTRGLAQSARTLAFFWRKKWELAYRYLGR